VIPKEATSAAVRKITYAIYLYFFAQFFIALRQLDKNPKYVFTLTGIKGMARWKLLPLAVFECYMSFTISTCYLFYIVVFVIYLRTTNLCLRITW